MAETHLAPSSGFELRHTIDPSDPSAVFRPGYRHSKSTAEWRQQLSARPGTAVWVGKIEGEAPGQRPQPLSGDTKLHLSRSSRINQRCVMLEAGCKHDEYAGRALPTVP